MTAVLVLTLTIAITQCIHPIHSMRQNSREAIRDKATEDDMKVAAMSKPCTKGSPCACMEVMSGEARHKDDGDVIFIEYPEFLCDKKLNKRRWKMGIMPQGVMCEQIKRTKTIDRYQLFLLFILSELWIIQV